jgi:uncharacterized protein YodC (DUF2158 family)
MLVIRCFAPPITLEVPMSEEFKVGDVVQLNSGGPLMTVSLMTGGDVPAVECVFFRESKTGIDACFSDVKLPARAVSLMARAGQEVQRDEYGGYRRATAPGRTMSSGT